MNESQSRRLEFWTQFNEILEERGKPFNKRKATTDHWYSVALGSSECHLSIDLVNREHKIRIGLWIDDNKDLYDSLEEKKDEIEEKTNIKFEWDRLDDKKASVICKYIDGLDFDNQSNYKDLMNKVIDEIVVLKNVFSKYI